MKLVSFAPISIILLSLIITVRSTNAEPSSCIISAITIKEKEAVDILQQMYGLQSKMKIAGAKLDELHTQKRTNYDRYNSDSVAKYNDLVAEYNKVVGDKNRISNQYNHLKDSYNRLIKEISPSTNISFVSCLNSELLSLQVNTTKLNTDSLRLDTNNLKLRTEDFKNRMENLRKNMDN